MTKPFDTRLIMMVAQKWFDTVDGNQFCKLIPIVYVDGTPPEVEHFPNDGEVWWMLTAPTARLAEPGRLVVANLERAVRFDEDDPNSSYVQVVRDSVRELALNEGVQILDIPSSAISDIEEVVSSSFNLPMEVSPTLQVFLRFRGNLYGPFTAAASPTAEATGRRTFTFSPYSHSDGKVYQFEQTAFKRAAQELLVVAREDVSLNTQRRSESAQFKSIAVELLLSAGFERCLETNPQERLLKPVEQRLLGFAKELLSRKNRQDLQKLLRELEVAGRESANAKELAALVGHYKSMIASQDEALEQVTKALLESGLVGDDRIERAQKTFAEAYVKERSAELEAKIQEGTAAKTAELRQIEAQLRDLKSRLAKEEEKRRAQFERELAGLKSKNDAALGAERALLEKQKADFARDQRTLKQNLEQVTRELRERGDEVLNRYLTIMPLLGSSSRISGQLAAIPDTSGLADSKPAAKRVFELPAYVSGGTSPTDEHVKEEEFFDRFQRLVTSRGFVYRLLDLQRFHLSVKCGELTVLGGPSGIGKSSLPGIYVEALFGSEAPARPGCRMINVNPSWMEGRDLLGHLNALEGRFYPAESGLFQHLVYAHEEFVAKSKSSALYVACLDEMNLSQIEHYFSDFMMVLERDGPSRSIQCFASEAAGPDCQFKRWSTVMLSPALRFVGTVNFDETTRLLSDRFLDRVNLIELNASSLPSSSATGSRQPSSTAGPMVTLSDFEAWTHEGALPSDIGLLVDSMRPILARIGAPLSPRGYRAICRLVNSAAPLLSPAKAFDVQIAQRVVPRIRGLVSKQQLQALDSLIKLLSESNITAFDESLPMLQVKRESAISTGWDMED